VIGPSTTASSTPVTVTVCATFQFALVKTRLAGLTVPSAGLLEVRAMVTFAVGCVLRTTVKVAVPPASFVVSGVVAAVTVIPAASLSLFVTSTSAASRVL
jgi:hypothetical protein